MKLNRLHLSQILEQAATPSPSRTPNEQKIGDEYASCMDTAAIDKAGIAPLQPELDRIAALQIVGGIAAPGRASADDRRERLLRNGLKSGFCRRELGNQLLWRGRPRPAGARLLHAHRRQVGGAAQSICRSRRAGCSRWPANPKRRRKKMRTRVLSDRNAVGQGFAHHYRAARSAKSESPHRSCRIQKLLTHFSMRRVRGATHAPASGKMNDMEPKFFAEFNAVLADTPLDQIKTYLRWHLLHAYAGTSMPTSLRPREHGISMRIL